MQIPRCYIQVIHGSSVKPRYLFPVAYLVLLALAVLLCAGMTAKAQSRLFLSALDAGTGAPNTVSVETADLNNDGNPDLVTANYTAYFNGISVMLGKGDGTFQSGVVYAADYATFHVTIADFNRDGKLDLAATSTGFDLLSPVPGVISVLLGNGDGTFRSHVKYAVGYGAPPITTGDFNNDGNLDLATTNRVLLGNGDGTFQSPIGYGGGYAIAVADFNQDGKLDIVATSYGPYINLFLGKGDGTFQNVIKIAAGTRTLSISAGDLNGDGKFDLAFMNAGNGDEHGSVSVLTGNGDGTFKSTATYGFGNGDYSNITHAIAIIDLNADGKLDLALATSGGVRAMIGSGDGTFQSGLAYSVRGASLTAGDFNRDGKPDLVTVNLNSGDKEGASVLLGNGDGTFQGAVSYDAGGDSSLIVTGDFNADGKLDLATTHYWNKSLSILLGNGDGSLQMPADYAVASYPSAITVSDFNADGKLDLAIATITNRGTFITSDIGVMLGNGDGTFRNAVNAQALGEVSSIVADDFNGDGKVDLVAGDLTSRSIVLLTGKGDGTFNSAASFFAGRLRSLSVGDFNGDGKLDVAGADIDDKSIGILNGNGNGTFQSRDSHPIRTWASEMIAQDFNSDGNLDLAFIHPVYGLGSDHNYPGSFDLLFGNGDGTFKSGTEYKNDNHVFTSIAAADFNGDGKLDLSSVGDNVTVLLGNADGTFQSAVSYTAGYLQGAVGDFNGDGKPDLATTAGSWIGLLLNIAPNSAPTQVDGKVLDSKGAPLAGAFVTLKSASRTQQAITDSTGRYIFTNLLTGDFYTLTPASDNYSFSPASRSFSFANNKQLPTFTAAPRTNPLDAIEFFVRQQYLDFLGREPDQGGLDYWSAQISACGSDQSCINHRRIEISAAFFIEQEFQQTSFFITRIYKASLGRQPKFAEFKADRDKLAGQNDLEAKRHLFAEEFVQRAEFKSLYPDSISDTDFVNKLFDTANLRPYLAERQARIIALTLRTETRAEVLRDVAEMSEFKAREYNPAFVLAEYFGYLGRDPDAAGYQFWLNVLNSQPNNYKGMVCSFITSAEYQKRFSPLVTHSNAECAP